MRRRLAERLLALLLLALGAGCANNSPPVSELFEVTRLVTAAPVERAVEVTRVVIVTATPPPTGVTTFTTEDPSRYRAVVDVGPLTLDPATATDPASTELIQNVAEPLLYPHPREPMAYIPLLATDWDISEDARRYTFTIRPRVTFSNGNSLTAEDVAYTMQRMLLLSVPGGRQGLLLQPLLGYTSGDITEEIAGGAYAGSREALQANASARTLVAVCEQVKGAIVADTAAGTVSFNLVEPWGPFLAALSQPSSAIVDREWAISQGAWDGECDTWQEWYAPAATETALATAILGSGPYVLDYWTPGAEYLLVANEAYWRGSANPMWEGGPSGRPAIHNVYVQEIADDNQRWEMLRRGEVESAALSASGQLLAEELVGAVCDWSNYECEATSHAAAPLRRYSSLPQAVQGALFFNFDISAEGNPYLGSGRLDGNGIPPDFFQDLEVRKAFVSCFDGNRFIADTFAGIGLNRSSLVPSYLLPGVSPASAQPYSLQRCEEALSRAWNNQLPETGFRLQLPFQTGNMWQEAAAAMLQDNLREVSDNYRVEIIGLPQPLYLQALRERYLPLALFTWTPLLPDPHDWVAPAFSDEVATFQGMPGPLWTDFLTLVQEGAATTAPPARELVYEDLGELVFSEMPYVLLPQPATHLYQQRWIENWFYNPAAPQAYYYAYSLNGR